MIDAIKKMLLAGVGAAVITKDKAEVALDEFVSQGKVSAADAKKLARKLGEQGRIEFQSMSREIEERFRGFALGADTRAKARIAELEARIAALEGKKPRSTRGRSRRA